jgi:hypothetical protein
MNGTDAMEAVVDDAEFRKDPKLFVRKLRAAMNRVHPDGPEGDFEAFIAAQRKYRRFKTRMELL